MVLVVLVGLLGSVCLAGLVGLVSLVGLVGESARLSGSGWSWTILANSGYFPAISSDPKIF